MKKMWYFAPDYGEKDYLSDSAMEIFRTKGDDAIAFKGIAREVIQNSLDAKRDDVDAPLVLDFQLIEINKNQFPDLAGLTNHVNGTISFCVDNEKQNIALINSRKQAAILSQEEFTILKISDYNTKGVSGSGDLTSKKNKWKSLVYNDGDSIKDNGGSLGSFGLGKNASFAISSLRTVFYVTRDMEDNYAMEGVAKLYTSCLNGQKYFNEGYFCNEFDGKTFPLNEEEALSISSVFERKEKGTDVIIFEPNISLLAKENVKWYLIESIISNFFVAFLEGQLEVKVCGVEINHNNLRRIFTSLLNFYNDINETISQKLVCVKQYLETIENGDDVSGTLDYYGDISLKLYKTQDTKYKNVAIFREGGMLIKEIPVNSASQKFSGVLVVRGGEGNKFLKSIEDPNHSDFDPSRETDDRTLTASMRKTILNSFYSWIAQKAREFTHIDSSGSIALSGMEDYIQMPENGEFVKKEKKEVQVKKIKRSKKKEIERLYEKKNVEVEENGLSVPEIPHEEKKGNTGTNPNDYTPEPQGLREDRESSKRGLLKMYAASFTIPPVMKFDSNTCTLIFKTTTHDKKLNLKLSAVGEDGKENTFLPIITKAYDANENKMLMVKDGVIYDVSGEGVSKIIITFERKLNTRLKVFVYWEA